MARRAANPVFGRKQLKGIGHTVVDRQPGLPGLPQPLGGMQHFCICCQVIEIVPFVLEQTDLATILQMQAYPSHVIAL